MAENEKYVIDLLKLENTSRSERFKNWRLSEKERQDKVTPEQIDEAFRMADWARGRGLDIEIRVGKTLLVDTVDGRLRMNRNIESVELKLKIEDKVDQVASKKREKSETAVPEFEVKLDKALYEFKAAVATYKQSQKLDAESHESMRNVIEKFSALKQCYETAFKSNLNGEKHSKYFDSLLEKAANKIDTHQGRINNLDQYLSDARRQQARAQREPAAREDHQEQQRVRRNP